ncbi:MAG TPA: hypothetical protein VJ721_03410 [Chthoniobacterales bacterium]|nr:hypothetical protein [Chthoniobacterales bacterium]
MKRILSGVAIMLLSSFSGCDLFRSPEEVRQQTEHTVYRVPGGSVAEMPTPTLIPQKIPGESKKN